MKYPDDQLNCIYDKTGGYCYYCQKKLAFTNYGQFGRKGAWEADHNIPTASGGMD